MIASCWDWPSLKYAYYILENEPLDAGGWSPSRGIHRATSLSSTEASVSFDDCLPALPLDAKFVGVGDFCIGEMFIVKDESPRQRIEISELKARKNPEAHKAFELLNDRPQYGGTTNQSMRSNPSDEGSIYEDSRSKTVAERLVPIIASLGSGYFLYKTFQGLSKSDLTFKDVMVAWGTGVAIGVTIGQESSRHSSIRQEITND